MVAGRGITHAAKAVRVDELLAGDDGFRRGHQLLLVCLLAQEAQQLGAVDVRQSLLWHLIGAEALIERRGRRIAIALPGAGERRRVGCMPRLRSVFIRTNPGSCRRATA